jgi:hypothetical protein
MTEPSAKPDDDAEPLPVPHIPMPTETLIMDADSGRQLLRIDGYMPLPAGARIQLGKGGDPELPTDAGVTGIRLWGATPPGNSTILVLEVMLVEPDAMTDRP